MLNLETILNALRGVKYPGFSRDIVSFGIVKNVAVNRDAVSLVIELTSPNRDVATQLKAACEQTLRAMTPVSHVHVEVKVSAEAQGAAAPASAMASQNQVPGVN